MRDSYERRVDRLSVRPSVRHTLVLSQYGLHHQVAHGLLFFETKFYTLGHRATPVATASNEWSNAL